VKEDKGGKTRAIKEVMEGREAEVDGDRSQRKTNAKG
jgi:hypothetical protein